MKTNFAAVALSLAWSLASCTSAIPFDRLPAWELAHATRAKAPIPCFDGNAIDAIDLPQAVPYAVVLDEHTGSADTSNRRLAAALLRQTEPDFIVVQDLGSVDQGTVSQWWGNGLMTERRVFARVREAIAWRVAAVELGFDARPSDGVVLRAPRAALFVNGATLFEGDELLAIDGIPFRFGERLLYSPHWRRILELRPGDTTELVWLRPGHGRMSGRMRPEATTDAWRKLPKLFEVKRP